METAASIVDREAELNKLRALARKPGRKLALLTGRRRVGKTYLLTHCWPPEDYFLFTAARVTPEANRKQLIRDLAAWSGLDLRPDDYPSWRTAFTLLLTLSEKQPRAIVLDEFQYLAEDERGVAAVASELNAAWERPQNTNPVLLVLAGSVVSTMEALARGGAPLYGRFAWQHRLEPFDYWHAAETASFTDLRERAITYGVFGGTPRYLAAIDASLSLARNIQELVLARDGEVRALLETAIDQEAGLRDTAKYRTILRAVATGATGRNEIANRSGLGNDRALREKLETLIDLGYLERRDNVDSRPTDPARYSVADPAFRFYQRFVDPNRSILERQGTAKLWEAKVEPELDQYMGLEFERIVRQAYDRHTSDLGLPLVRQWGRWEGSDRERKSVEIDVVSPLLDGRTLTGSIKWNRSPVGAEVHYDHLDMLQRMSSAGRQWARAALDPAAPLFYVAAGGFSNSFHFAIKESEREVIAWDLADLYWGQVILP
ncbi:MAG TPA: ATP-binding protein [Trueperaceae bacterium]|nr:ATP-binding protein [Trueperaceae bacterium]